MFFENLGTLNNRRCQGCPRGTWGDQMATVNVAGCKACIAGLYNDAEGSMVGCKNCPKGKYLPTSKNTKDSDCQNCKLHLLTAFAFLILLTGCF